MWKEDYQTIQINGHSLAAAHIDTGAKKIIIFCHGYRSNSSGPRRFFVTAARNLADAGISSLRFDQYGSGNSEGDFIDSRFDDWVLTTVLLVREYLAQGYTVGLFGQSMGGATVIAAASEVSDISAVVSWVPDPSVDPFTPSQNGYFEEAGERVANEYWQQAHDANIAKKIQQVVAPMYIVQCTNDEYVSPENREAIMKNAQAHHQIKTYEGYPHSAWEYDQATTIINDSVNFLEDNMKAQE